jgi:uncharacterized protein
MVFEYDRTKSDSNRKKHGIDFMAAQALWDDPRCLVVPARSIDEERFALIGEMHGKLWTCVFTVREDRVRIISARRARDGEEEQYNQG